MMEGHLVTHKNVKEKFVNLKESLVKIRQTVNFAKLVKAALYDTHKLKRIYADPLVEI